MSSEKQKEPEIVAYLRKVLHQGAGFTQLEAYTLFKEYDELAAQLRKATEVPR